jgi:hypothetical protein
MIASGPVIPVFSRPLIDGRLMWLLCSFQGPWRGCNTALRSAFADAISISRLRRSQRGAGLSKLNSMLGLLRPRPVALPK